MKKIALTFGCLLFCTPNLSHAFDTSLRGFISLDALNYEKVEKSKGAAVIGIGVLDLKVFATKDDLTAAIKLDLDGKLDKENNIFEEAYVTYKGLPKTKILLGKGVVRFQNLHWGALVNSYQDGGTVIGTENSFRKFSRKAFLAISYGEPKDGYSNQFTLWGDSLEMEQTDNGLPVYTTNSSGGNTTITGYKTRDVTAFNTSKQLGLANKLDIFFTKELKMNISGIYYKNHLHNKASYGADIGLNYEGEKMEIWLDTVYGVTSKLPYESYTTSHKKEYFMQLGMEYYLNEKWSLVENVEGLFVKDTQHVYTSGVIPGTTPIAYNPSSQQAARSGHVYESLTYKLESAVKYRLTSSSHITLGALYESKTAKNNGQKNVDFNRDVKNPNLSAYKFLSSVSFWF